MGADGSQSPSPKPILLAASPDGVRSNIPLVIHLQLNFLTIGITVATENLLLFLFVPSEFLKLGKYRHLEQLEWHNRLANL